jgi:putative addiction module killer protein
MKWIIRQYITPAGCRPFGEWLDRLPVQAQARVAARIARFESGNLGDHKAVGSGVWEARLSFGPGYRVYFGQHGQTSILLLLGGSKVSQQDDIRRAQGYWSHYLEEKHGTTQ